MMRILKFLFSFQGLLTVAGIFGAVYFAIQYYKGKRQTVLDELKNKSINVYNFLQSAESEWYVTKDSKTGVISIWTEEKITEPEEKALKMLPLLEVGKFSENHYNVL